jgi:hypothetical protein
METFRISVRVMAATRSRPTPWFTIVVLLATT